MTSPQQPGERPAPDRFPGMPSPAVAVDQPGAPPPQVRVAAALLIANLVLSVLVTVLSIVDKNQIITVTLHAAGRSGMTEAAAKHAITTSLWSRAIANVVVGVLYVFLISRLYRGKRWAWRRLVWLSIAGSVGMVYLLTTPYPVIFKVEQVIQLAVLVSIAACVLHPRTRAHYAKPV